MCALGGASTVQLVPEHSTLGMIVRAPIELPCVDETEPSKVTVIPPFLAGEPSVKAMFFSFQSQSRLDKVKVGRGLPFRR